MVLSNYVKHPPAASFYLLLVALMLIVGTVSAATTFTPFVAYGDAWKSTNDTYTVIKWNATTNLGVRSPWIAKNNVTPDTIIEYVVVGGGGGGGSYPGGGGGGAGAYWEGTISGLTGANSITVGAGGTNGTTLQSGKSGNNSILFGNRLDNITANGGSGGGSRAVGGTLVLQGGSAGGGGSPAGAAGTGQTNTSNQAGHGNGGGLGLNVTITNYQGGGGGSIIGAGKDAASNKGGNAGDATYTMITGTPLVLAGGGGGGTYSNTITSKGIGGMNGSVLVGGNGSYYTTVGTAAVVNTGSGGGGGGATRGATAGSGGVIIIRYFTPPAVNNIVPPTGPIGGGTNVKINGTHFTGATAVTFGSNAATSFSVENDTSINAVTCANLTPGLVYVNVSTPNGTAIGVSKYTYVALPTVTSIAPPTGPVAGGTPIIITGTNLIGANIGGIYNVSINGTALTNISVVSATSIRGSTLTGIAGLVNINITTPNGTSVTGTKKYTYVDLPKVINITPSTGSTAGGTPITIYGENLIGATKLAGSMWNVSIGGINLTNMTVVSSTKITGSTLAHGSGLVDVFISTPNGTSVTGTGVYTYVGTPTLSSVSPMTGPIAGGTWVNITGTNVIGATAITFGGTASTGISIENSTALIAKTPAHAAGLVYVNVTTPNGTAAGPGAYTYVSLPTVASVLPPTGPLAGGTSVTITGTNLTGATAVTFGGTAVTSFSVENVTSIIAITPVHSAGLVYVNVSTPNGTAIGTSKYTYVALPTVVSVAPATGPITGITNVTITGTNLTGASTVTFDNIAATNVTVFSSTIINASTPAHAAGLVNINVTTPNGTSVTGSNKYAYVAVPSFTSITPVTGSTAGGTNVTLKGTNLIGATAITFDGLAAPYVKIVNATTVNASTPAHGSGLVDVIITTPNGTAPGVSAFTYVGTPTLSSVSPMTGPIAGGTWVNITGMNVIGATAVTFGGTAATGISIENDTALIAKTPAHAAGLVYVNVTTPNGTAAGPGAYTYVSLPTVASVLPPTGPLAGGTSVNITGTNLTGATAVTFGGTAVTSFSVENVTSIIAITPVHSAGLVYVNVSTPNGTAIGTSKYTYVALPTVVSVAPATGPITGITNLTITGTNLTGASTVTFDNIAATNVTVFSSTIINVSTPVHAAGLVNINVTTPNGTSVTGTNKYTYVAVPMFTSITPVTGSTAGGTNVTIKGTNLIGATAVTFDGLIAPYVKVVNATTVNASTPAHGSGLVDVIITTPNGTALEGTGAYTYGFPPTVASVAPPTAPISGITNVTITGTNLTGATAVTFGGTLATNITVIDDTTIKASAPAHSAGLVNVNVTTPNGISVTGTGVYLYVSLPTVTSVAPPTGPLVGGTGVTIIGTNLTGATAVTFGGTLATDVSVVNVTAITATTPAHSAGLVYVNVSTPNGTAIGTSKYTYVTLPTVVSVAPATGPITGITNVTITGTNLTGASAVTFDNIAATNITVFSSTIINASTPVHAAGLVNINVTTPNGTSVTGTNKYTYVAVPSFTSITPVTGSTAGGTNVTLKGTNLIGATAITFGGLAAPYVKVVNATTVNASTPAHAAGLVDVLITTPNGTATGGTGTYTYVGPPTFTSIMPASGTTAGGTTVTISGTNLIGANAGGVNGNVTIGGSLATIVSVVSGSITATTPAHAAGAVNVVITTPNGTATGTGVYSYGAPPTFTSITPATGTTAGGTTVTISGTNLIGANAGGVNGNVTIGGSLATIVSVISGSITATTPAHAAGSVDVVITTPNGTATGTGVYSYKAPPTFTSITPASGTTAGGTPVTINGTNLIGANAGGVNGNVTIGGSLATIVSVVNGSITATTPAHAAGAVDIIITTPNGTATGGAGAYTYVSGPTVTNIAPPTGQNTTTISIANLKGTGFFGTPTVNLTKTGENNITATDVTVASATKITCTFDLSGKTVGAWNVTVINPDGQLGSLIEGFTVTNSTPSPTVSSITPSTGQNTTSVTITNLAGTGFLSGATVKLTKSGQTDVVATGVTVVSATRINCTFDLTGKAAGPWNIVVTNTDTKTGTLPNGFTVTGLTPAPTITSISPATGIDTTSVTITDLAGTGFLSGATVNLTKTGEPNIVATGVTVVSATRITCTFNLTGKAAGP